jgi:DNA modification methylase
MLQKLKHSGDNKPVKVYQKPRELLDWMVGHFSRPDDWVLDLCSESGTGLASCMAYDRHCAAVEIDLRQARVLQEQVLNLEEREDKNLRTTIQYGELRSQENMKEPEEVVGGAEGLDSQEKLGRQPTV